MADEGVRTIAGEVPRSVKEQFQAEVKRRGYKQRDALAEALIMWISKRPKRTGLDTSQLKVGDALYWEPTKQHAFEYVQVTEIKTNSDGETWVAMRGAKGNYWNEIERVREACVWHADWVTGDWQKYHPIDVDEGAS